MMKKSDILRIASYYDATLDAGQPSLSDNEWEDLNLNEFFFAVDCTSSCIGRQYLYSLLRYGVVSDIGRYEALIDRLSTDKELRAKLITILAKLENQDAYNIASLLSEAMPMPSARKLLLSDICRFLPFLFAGITLLTHTWGWLCGFIVAFVVNLILHCSSKKHIYQHYLSIPQFLRMLRQMDFLVEEPVFVSVNKEITRTLDAYFKKMAQIFQYKHSLGE